MKPIAREIGRGIARGAAAGAVATVAMTALMYGAQKAGLLGRMPPRKITEHLLSRLGLRRATPEPARRALAAIAHLGFGASCGAVFGAGHEVVRARLAPGREVHAPVVVAGLAYATAIWAVSYAGWVPALGIMPRPRFDRPGRPTAMVLAHGIYGAVLARFVDRSAERPAVS
jgi:hypothetical protein